MQGPVKVNIRQDARPPPGLRLRSGRASRLRSPPASGTPGRTSSIGLVPISLAASGAIADVNPTVLFLISGGLILLASAAAASSRTVRSLR